MEPTMRRNGDGYCRRRRSRTSTVDGWGWVFLVVMVSCCGGVGKANGAAAFLGGGMVVVPPPPFFRLPPPPAAAQPPQPQPQLSPLRRNAAASGLLYAAGGDNGGDTSSHTRHDKDPEQVRQSSSKKIREMAVFLAAAMTQSLLTEMIWNSEEEEAEPKEKEETKLEKNSNVDDEKAALPLLDLDIPNDEIKLTEAEEKDLNLPIDEINKEAASAPLREQAPLVADQLNDDVFKEDSRREELLEKETASSMHVKEGDRVVALKDEFSPEDVLTEDEKDITKAEGDVGSVISEAKERILITPPPKQISQGDDRRREDLLEKETASSMHAKEGDRVVALKDEFSLEDVLTEDEEDITILPPKAEDDEETSISEAKERILITLPPNQASKGDDKRGEETGSSTYAKVDDIVVALKDEIPKADDNADSADSEAIKRILITPPPKQGSIESPSVASEITKVDSNLVTPPSSKVEQCPIVVVAPPTSNTLDTNKTTNDLVTTMTPPMSTTETLHDLIPPIPDVISTAFGRPLVVVRDGVSPLRPEQPAEKETVPAILTSLTANSESTFGKPLVTVQEGVPPLRSTGPSNEDASNVTSTTNHGTLAAAALAAPKITRKTEATDEDPYGE